MSLSHYWTLGRYGLRVSPLSLDAMSLGRDCGRDADAIHWRRIIHN